MFPSFLKFRIVGIVGIETPGQPWNKISSLFLNNSVRLGCLNPKGSLERPTVDFVHVEVSRCACPPNHRCVLQLAQQCRIAPPKNLAETHVAFSVNTQLRFLGRRLTNIHCFLHCQLLFQVVLVQGHKILWMTMCLCTLEHSSTSECNSEINDMGAPLK